MDIIRRIKSEGKPFMAKMKSFDSLLVKLIKIDNEFLWVRTEEQTNDVYPEIAPRKFKVIQLGDRTRYSFPFQEDDLDIDDNLYDRMAKCTKKH